jgi:DNA-directed RNA polymerase subunit RPC12/RpoP
MEKIANMNDDREVHLSQGQNYNFAQGEEINQQALEDSFRTIQSTGDVIGDTNDGSPTGQYHYYRYESFKDDSAEFGSNQHNQNSRAHFDQYEKDSIQYQRINGAVERPSSNPNVCGVSHDDHHSNQLAGLHDQYLSHSLLSAAALPIPAMALQVSNLSHNFAAGPIVDGPPMTDIGVTNAHDGVLQKARCIEEDYAIILHRSSSTTAKSSNTKYRCMFCNFTFVGGPQKIRVHLTGKRENGTRVSRCEHCPEDVRRRLEERMKAPKGVANETGLYEDDESDATQLPPRNVEEHHMVVLSRSQSSNSKSSNTHYKCIYCRFKFVGGPQKIRVHLTGEQEGGTRMQKCARAPEEVVLQMEHRRKAPKPDLLSTPGGSANAVTSSISTSSSQAYVDSSTSTMTEVSQPARQSQQQALIIAQQQLALVKQQQEHAAQLQIQEQQLQYLRRQQQLQQQLHAQQQIQQQEHIQQLQQLHQQQIQAQMQQQLMQHSLHGGHHLNTQPAATQLHGSSLSLPLHPQQVRHRSQPTSSQMLMHQQQLRQRAQLSQHLSRRQQLPPHLPIHNTGSCADNHPAPHESSLLTEDLLSPQLAHDGLLYHLYRSAAQVRSEYDLHTEAAYYAELQQQLLVAQAAAAQTTLSLTQPVLSTHAAILVGQAPVEFPSAESGTKVTSATAELAAAGEASRRRAGKDRPLE